MTSLKQNDFKDEFVGLRVVEEDVIKCNICKSPLAFVLVSETNEDRKKRQLKPIRTQFKFDSCYKCQGKSNLSKLYEGSVNIAESKPNIMTIEEVNTEVNDQGIIIVILKASRK
jgi:hypothetical protein